ncbi:INO80 complex subunit C [Pancytospora philotis]|nr:INO80 complex subunit C [Pancytospora philotis]
MDGTGAKDVSRYKLTTRAATPAKNKTLKNMYRAMVAQEHPYLALTKISVMPPRRLCDFTGLPAPYTCPRTSLRFFNLSVYKYLRSLSSEHSENYYSIKMYGKNLQNGSKK